MRGGAAARQRSGRRRDPRAAVSAAPADCGRRFRGRGFSFGSTGALRPRRSSISWMRSPGSTHVVAMAKNAVLQRHAESAMQVARAQSEVGGETAHVYTDTRYAARTWDHVAPGRDQGRSRSPSETASRGTTRSVRGDESAADAALHL